MPTSRWLAALAAFGLVAILPSVVRPQRQPSFSFDATIGGGTGHGGEFYDRGIVGGRVAVSIRIAGSAGARVLPYGEIAMDWLAITMGHDALCVISPRGGCMQPFPELSGPSLSVGLLNRPKHWVELRGGLGTAAYTAEGTRVGAVSGSVDTALFPTDHIGVVVGTRLIVVPRYRRDRLWTNPWALGVRVRR